MNFSVVDWRADWRPEYGVPAKTLAPLALRRGGKRPSLLGFGDVGHVEFCQDHPAVAAFQKARIPPPGKSVHCFPSRCTQFAGIRADRGFADPEPAFSAMILLRSRPETPLNRGFPGYGSGLRPPPSFQR